MGSLILQKKSSHYWGQILQLYPQKKEMKESGINESKLAKKLKLSRNAVNEVMKWLKLNKSMQNNLLRLEDSSAIRNYSRRWRKDYLKENPRQTHP